MEKTNIFLSYMSQQLADMPTLSLSNLMQKAGSLDRVFLIFVDMIKGFCETGPLSSERVNEMVEPVTKLAHQLLQQGLPNENLIFLNDYHPENAVEFNSFAPHCIRGTVEAEVVEPLKTIQERPGAQTFRKNATNGMFGSNEQGTRFFEWLEQVLDQGPSAFVVVGDCTDLCIYQNAMGIRLFANEKNAQTHVIVPQTHVKTYDVSVELAKQLGIWAHDADLMDLMFLYHMNLNGIEVVSTVTEA